MTARVHSGDGSTAEVRGSEAVADVHAARLDAIAAAALLWLFGAKEVRELLLVNVERIVEGLVPTLYGGHTHGRVIRRDEMDGGHGRTRWAWRV